MKLRSKRRKPRSSPQNELVQALIDSGRPERAEALKRSLWLHVGGPQPRFLEPPRYCHYCTGKRSHAVGCPTSIIT